MSSARHSCCREVQHNSSDLWECPADNLSNYILRRQHYEDWHDKNGGFARWSWVLWHKGTVFHRHILDTHPPCSYHRCLGSKKSQDLEKLMPCTMLFPILKKLTLLLRFGSCKSRANLEDNKEEQNEGSGDDSSVVVQVPISYSVAIICGSKPQ